MIGPSFQENAQSKTWSTYWLIYHVHLIQKYVYLQDANFEQQE